MHELPADDVVEVNVAILNSAHVELLDNARLVDQLCGLVSGVIQVLRGCAEQDLRAFQGEG